MYRPVHAQTIHRLYILLLYPPPPLSPVLHATHTSRELMMIFVSGPVFSTSPTTHRVFRNTHPRSIRLRVCIATLEQKEGSRRGEGVGGIQCKGAETREPYPLIHIHMYDVT